jgi:hypothetical protein
MLPDLVETMSSTRDLLTDLLTAYARRRPVRSIVIVGNAPLSPCADRAAAIDGADLVVRTTSFALDRAGDDPTYGRNVDVVLLHRGTKASPWLFEQYRRRLYLLAEPGRLHWEPEQFPDWWPSDMGYLPLSNRDWTIPLCELAGMDVRNSATWTTTGTLGIYVMTELFPHARTSIAGFSIIDDAGQSVFAHAWGAPVNVTTEHRLDREQALLRRWITQGRIHQLP